VGGVVAATDASLTPTINERREFMDFVHCDRSYALLHEVVATPDSELPSLGSFMVAIFVMQSFPLSPAIQ
jgi:hypothetical protein